MALSAFTGFLGAETNQWYPDLVYDSHPVDPPRSPAEGYHMTEELTDKALEFIKDAKALAPEKPFFLYYAPGACHASRHGSVLEAAPGLVHTERQLGCLASQPTVTEAPGPGCLPAFWTGSRQQT